VVPRRGSRGGDVVVPLFLGRARRVSVPVAAEHGLEPFALGRGQFGGDLLVDAVELFARLGDHWPPETFEVLLTLLHDLLNVLALEG
jgi:hypothetical protein